ncbi:helix-turn-helix transcriptional regulator [Weizmannia sp. CD-2023]|mgnify:CR=1 FL=1|jgi:transcriptional regulator with XRE-family HTH domain|nr:MULTISPECIES: helix-turn-helix transcriptional regulator [Heyndrickxia]MED4840263.1 helix-turn-helix transcriptional regulator [Weizmannia sp. CD-2023]MED4902833.1 helix-turn-helix transcriptional regulator [Weizmannia sp. CD-2023]NWN95300.1 helix-turn-helix transcriptional regulator [Bacillus sp. (in: firmicutes)]
MSILSERLKELRKKHKLTQKDVADFLGMSESGYGYYEQGRNEPSIDTLRKLADKYGVNVSYLTGEEDKKDKKFNSFEEISKLIEQYGFDQFGFFDIDKWKNLSKDDIDEIRRHFEWVAQKAKERNDEKSSD